MVCGYLSWYIDMQVSYSVLTADGSIFTANQVCSTSSPPVCCKLQLSDNDITLLWLFVTMAMLLHTANVLHTDYEVEEQNDLLKFAFIMY